MTKVPHILKIDTIEELNKYIASIPSNIPSSEVSESYIDISDDLVDLLPWETKELLWNNHVYFRLFIEGGEHFKAVRSTLKYEFVKGSNDKDFENYLHLLKVIFSSKLSGEQLFSLFSEGLMTIEDIIRLQKSTEYSSFLINLFYKLSREQSFKLVSEGLLSRLISEGLLSRLISEGLMTIKGIVELCTATIDSDNLVNFILQNGGWDIVTQGLPVHINRISLDTIKLALKRGLKAEYVIKHSDELSNSVRDNLVNFILQNGGWDVANRGLPLPISHINPDTIELVLEQGLKAEYVIKHIDELSDYRTSLAVRDTLVNFILQRGGWDVANKGLPVPINHINLDTIKLALERGLKAQYVIEHIDELSHYSTNLVVRDTLVNFILQNDGWDVANKGLPVPINRISLDTLKLAFKKGLKPGYVIERTNEFYDFTTCLSFISVAVDNGGKLDDLDWSKLRSRYGKTVNDIKDISTNFLLSAIKNNLLDINSMLTYTIKNQEQKIDFISNISAMGNDLNDMNFKMFTLGFSTDQIKTFLERGLRVEKLIPILPELFSASNSKAELLRCLVGFGLELKIFEDNNSPAIIPHLDMESLQFLLDNGMTTVGIVWTIFQDTNSGVDQEVLNEHLQFLIENQSATDGLKTIFRIGETTDTRITKARLTKKALIDKLIKGALDRGADINSIVNDKDFISFPIEFLFLHKDLLFLHPKNSLSADNTLNVALRANIRTDTSTFERYEYDLKKVGMQGELFSIALDKGLDLKGLSTGHFVDRHISLKALALHKELWLSHPTNSLSADSILKLALGAGYTLLFNETTKQYKYYEEEIMHQGELIVAALDRNADVNGIMSDENLECSSKCFFEHIDLLRYHPTNPLSAENTLRIILQMRMDTYNHTTEKPEYDLEKCKVRDELIKYAVDQGVDFNTKISSAEFSLTFFEKLFVSNNFEMVDFVLNLKSYSIGATGWVSAIEKNYGISFLTNALKRFSDGFSKDEAKDMMRAQGTSHALITSITDIYDLAKDIIEAMVAEESSALSDIELRIFNTTEEISLADCAKGKYKNRFGFSQLSLALLAKRFELAIEMINAGASLIEINNNGVTPIQIFKRLSDANQVPQDHEKTLDEVIFEKLENLDVILNKEGESLIDSYLRDERFKDEALARTNDPLFAFYKPNASLFSPSLHPELTHIGISMGDDFWSTGLNAAARLIRKWRRDVVFHLVTLEMMETGGNRFISQFNGWINPGAGDSFPGGKVEFNKNDWQQSMGIEQAYQRALDKTYELKIPYTGMCAGAQNFALYHGAYLQPLQGYSHGEHSVTYIKGTIAHFMAMTKEQQKQALQDCEFPEIQFKGDTAHHYAAIPNKLGDWLQLGAVSEDGVAMSYCHKNGLACATQFHPEHYYHIQDEGNHQKIWLENFIGLVKLHHDHIQLGGPHPEVIYKQVYDRLAECLKAPVCLVERNEFNNSTIAGVLFKHYGTDGEN